LEHGPDAVAENALSAILFRGCWADAIWRWPILCCPPTRWSLRATGGVFFCPRALAAMFDWSALRTFHLVWEVGV